MICSYIPACISKDADLAKRLVQEHIAYYIGGMGTFYYKTISRYGFEKEANLIVEAWKKGSKSQAMLSVSDRLLNSVAIFGSQEEGRRKIEGCRKAGIGLPILIFPLKSSREIVKETIIKLAPEG
jgi:hypothetical protein